MHFSCAILTCVLQYRFRDFAGAGHFCHVAESVLRPRAYQLHTHDFREVFWVRGGAGRHVINDGEMELRPGMLVLIHAGDRHALCPADGDVLEIVNIAFARQSWKALQERYGAEEEDPFEQGVEERHRDLTGVRYTCCRMRRRSCWATVLRGRSGADLRWNVS